MDVFETPGIDQPLVTHRLRLRLLQAGDAAWLAREIAHPDVQRWLTSPPHPYRLSDAQAFIAAFGANPWFRVIEADGVPQGVVSVGHTQDPDPQRSAADELGYWLAVSAHGRGYMTEAAGAMVDAFFAGGSEEIVSGWIEGNGASENVLTKLGFARTGETVTRHVNFLGEPRPVVRVRLTRQQWPGARALRSDR